MPAHRGGRRWRPRPTGLKQCAICRTPIGHLQQHRRWAAGFTIIVCPTHATMTGDQLGRELQQILALGAAPDEGPQEVG